MAEEINHAFFDANMIRILAFDDREYLSSVDEIYEGLDEIYESLYVFLIFYVFLFLF
jgi:hypothetical protein